MPFGNALLFVKFGTAFSWVNKDYPNIHSFKDLVEIVGQQSRRLDLFATVTWFVWYRRNKLRLKEACLPIEKIYEQALKHLDLGFNYLGKGILRSLGALLTLQSLKLDYNYIGALFTMLHAIWECSTLRQVWDSF